mgnify:CR=1 FL=1
MKCKILDGKRAKALSSEHYNFLFDKETGFFARWGEKKEDDPEFSPFGPELVDIEISTICSKGCSFCYKSNTSNGKNMDLETFKKVFAKLPPTVTQIAFGIGDIDSNPDLWAIMEHCRENGVIPNITINGFRMTEEFYQKLAELCGAVAVSNYGKASCYSAVEKLASFVGKEGCTLKQVNIHQCLYEENYNTCMDLLTDIKEDSRLAKLNAVVFLIMKPKGSRNQSTQLTDPVKYKALIDKALDLNVSWGGDSCQAEKILLALKDHPDYEKFETVVESCESSIFSIYIDVDAKVYPCSFTPGIGGWNEGIDVLKADDFLKEVWGAEKISSFRETLLGNAKKSEVGCRTCPLFKL